MGGAGEGGGGAVGAGWREEERRLFGEILGLLGGLRERMEARAPGRPPVTALAYVVLEEAIRGVEEMRVRSEAGRGKA